LITRGRRCPRRHKAKLQEVLGCHTISMGREHEIGWCCLPNPVPGINRYTCRQHEYRSHPPSSTDWDAGHVAVLAGSGGERIAIPSEQLWNDRYSNRALSDLVFDEFQRRSMIPLVSIVRATSQRANMLGLTKVGLLGTGFTMRASFYPEEFQGAGIVAVGRKRQSGNLFTGSTSMSC
jgi:hypothetical protein